MNFTPRAQILIIEDDPNWANWLSLALEKRGFRPTIAETARKGLELLMCKFQRWDMVLLDLMMPDMLGTDMLRSFLTLPNVSRVPVIIQTGTTYGEEIDQALAMGAVNYLEKPFGEPELYAALSEALKPYALVS